MNVIGTVRNVCSSSSPLFLPFTERRPEKLRFSSMSAPGESSSVTVTDWLFVSDAVSAPPTTRSQSTPGETTRTSTASP